MSSVAKVLADLHTLFDRQSIQWYVFGAQAVVVFGRPRQTLDIDVTVNLTTNTVKDLPAKLEEAGFTPRVEQINTFAARSRVMPVLHRSSGIPVDLILAGPGLETEFFERVVTVDIQGMPIPFISAEDLVAIKVLAGRPKDHEDVRGIIANQGNSFDDSRTRDVLQRLERALDRNDLVTRYESLARDLR